MPLAEDDAEFDAVSRAPTSRLNKRVFLLALAVFSTVTDAFVVAGLLPLIAHDLSVSVGVVGQIVTAYMLTSALGSPFIAALSASWPRQRLIVSCLALFALAAGISAGTPGLGILIAARVMAALFSATYTPAAFSMAAVLSPTDRQGAGLALVALGIVLAQLFGVPFGTWVAHTFGWRVTFALDAALVAGAALALRMAGIPAIQSGPPPTLASRFSPLVSPKILIALIPSVLWAIGPNAIYFYSAVLFGSKLGAGSVVWLLFILGLGGLAGSQLGGRLCDRFGPMTPITVSLAVMALDIALMEVASHSFVTAALALFVMSTCSWALFPLQQNRLLKLAPEHSLVVLALNNSAAVLGSAIGAMLGALILDRLSPAELPYAAGGVTVAALMFFLAGRLADAPVPQKT